MLSFCGQLYLLMWKISLQKLRRPLTTLCEVMCPIGFLLLLVLIRSLLKVEEHGIDYTNIHNADSWQNTPIIGLTATLCKQRGKIVGVWDVAGMIGVYPKTNVTETLLSKVGEGFRDQCLDFHKTHENYAEFQTCFPSSCNWNDYLYWFTLADEIEKFIFHETYAQNPVFSKKSSRSLGAAIIFNDISPTSFDYVLRYNVTLLPSTDPNDKWDKLSRGVNRMYSQQYRYSGFTTLQKWLDLAHIGISNVGTVGIGDFNFPAKGYTSDSFTVYISFVLGNFMMLAFTVPFSVLAKNLVEEKQMLIKESIQIVGCTEHAY